MSNENLGATADLPEDFEEKYEMYQRMKEEHGFAHSEWSIYEVTDFSATPFPQARVLQYESGWDGKLVEVQLSPNCTWLDLWKASDQAIQQSGDEHHIFIEILECEDGVVTLFTGS